MPVARIHKNVLKIVRRNKVKISNEHISLLPKYILDSFMFSFNFFILSQFVCAPV